MLGSSLEWREKNKKVIERREKTLLRGRGSKVETDGGKREERRGENERESERLI